MRSQAQSAGRRSRPRKLESALAALLLTGSALVAACGSPEQTATAAAGCPGDSAPATGWSPSNTEVDTGIDRHPFVGNGYLGLRVPTRGMGYYASREATGWPLYTPAYDGAFVAGLYGNQPGVAEDREVAAAIPNWSTLLVSVGAEQFSPATPAAQISNFTQTLYQRCGLVHTELTWTTPDGKATDLTYEVLTDRTDQHVGAVRLTAVPRWSGELVVTDKLDGAGARRITQTGGGARDDRSIGVDFRTAGTGVAGSVVSVLDSGTAKPDRGHEPEAENLSVSQETRIPVRADTSYTITKYVGVDTARTATVPAAAAFAAAQRAARIGWPELLARSAGAWRELWRGDIEVPGDRDIQSWTRGALYSLYSATNATQDNSISPVGLSSDNYGGLVFWDADIWMYPGLLHLAPALAKSVVEYRFKTLPAAQANAARLGYRGSFYPWTSATDGDLEECHSWDPPHCLTQIHLQGDISLAAWQYYLGTGDKGYLRERIWPIMRNIAEFWASRVRPNADGSYSILDVAGPDEYSNGVNDAVYTNGGAALALRHAVRAAEILGVPAPAEWSTIANGLRMPFDPARQIFLQYDGYGGTPTKQADTVLLVYPLDWPMSPQAAANVLEYYSERTDPDGPAMTDSVNAIDAARIGAPGCATDTYLERSVRPFIRGPFAQFAEARGAKAGALDPLAGAPAFTFTTAAGGFLQTFTNGLLGLRLHDSEIEIAPLLPAKLGSELRIRGIHWQGRVFDAEIGAGETRITVTQGAPMPVRTTSGTQLASAGTPLVLPTRRPDIAPGQDLSQCKAVRASSAESGRYGDAAVDGTLATAWSPDGAQGTLTVDLGRETTIGAVVPHWTDPAPTAFTLAVSVDEKIWAPVDVDPATGQLSTAATGRYVRLDVTGSDAGHPGVRELDVTAPR
ncbi:discoidin domain-containing protein [Nocardia goodfellowii]|uniref:Trehalose/maltose hydrolase-like predicted phosphorylase n=1 Tax=Nocardia goodfellowii TaxID=882446 RepID=A0ABS4QDI6_9NOCA|nr:discoidin domain-containing protein [Nocardia goodfellowii]MBP2189757.1 trehalose/maltose hydrolase-like predicted phosphorylase [Nocardia goodfellowii]